jgi:hypothetical protein
VEELFETESVRSQLLPKEEHRTPLRDRYMNKRREEHRWTSKANTIWQCTELLLKAKGWLPNIKQP